MFNSIYVPCRKCGNRVEFQTKSGTCILDSWDIENAPNIEVEGIIGDSWRCNCGHLISVEKDESAEIKIKLKVK